MDNKKKKSIILITFTLIILVVTTLFIVINCTKTDELISVKSKKDLEKLFEEKAQLLNPDVNNIVEEAPQE